MYCSDKRDYFSTGGALFFFQAEDGIRDLVRSRGLGDVYKRQGCDSTVTTITTLLPSYNITLTATTCDPAQAGTVAVSYTHLTLPTSDLV